MGLRPLRAAVENWKPGRSVAADPLYRIASSWVDVVGGHAAAQCEPVALNGTTLLIATRSSAWSQQLQFLSTAILTAVDTLAPGRITRLAFRTGGMRAPARRGGAAKPVGRSPIGPGSPGPGGIGGLRHPEPVEGRPAFQQRPDFQSAPDSNQAPATDTAEALARLRARLVSRRSAGAGERCAGCEAPLEAGGGNARCAPCAGAAERARLLEIQRLVYMAPWLNLAELREQMPDLAGVEFEAARRTLLARWWLMLERARRAGSISASGIERHVASSYVLLQSRLPPDRITPAIAANLLGAELAALIASSREDRGDPARSSNKSV
jgi:hypothetical protein